MRQSLQASAAAHLVDDETHAPPSTVAPLVPDAVAAIAHELKTPLASILGYARMLRSGWDSLEPARRDEFFAVVELQGRRLQHMIENMLQCARSDAGPAKLQRDPVDVARVVGRAVTTVSGMADRRRITVSVPPGDLGLYGDATALEHVVSNLLENAIKYTPDQTNIGVLVVERPTEVRFSVTDEGPGIAPADLPFVFERFRRGNGVVHGVGLGLHIVRSLVESHNGRVWVESTPGEGTTFTFVLPRRANG
ncbi:MAG TPA: ATP-binding protein [Actinomycetota bacterium]